MQYGDSQSEQRGHDGRMNSNVSSPVPRFSFAYTVYLMVISGFSLLGIASMEMVLATTQAKPSGGLSPEYIRAVQGIQGILFLITLVVAILRVRRSELARAATAAVSILLILWFPFGTAAFIWWVGWVRPTERSS